VSRVEPVAGRFGLTLPDEPRWVEAHGLLADPASWHRPFAGGGLVGHDAAELAVLHGGGALADVRAAVAAALAACPGLTVLCADEVTAGALAAALGRRALAAALHTLAEPLDPLDADDGGVAPLHPTDDLAHLPAALRHELGRAADRPVWTAWVEGAPVSFAYASWRSPRWFDVSVDTAPGYRQLGLGERVARALILDEQRAGRRPVWGALEDNLASRRLAARLGFSAQDKLWVIA
jgi:GNAT superfamily N-acetyltransferase